MVIIIYINIIILFIIIFIFNNIMYFRFCREMELRVKCIEDIQALSWFQGVDWSHIRYFRSLMESLQPQIKYAGVLRLQMKSVGVPISTNRVRWGPNKSKLSLWES